MLDLAVSVAVAAALLGPWAARNQDQLGAPVLVSTNFGPNLWMGNNPASTGGYMPLPKEDFGGEVEREAALKQRALDFILARPDRYLELSAARFFQSFSRETIGVAWNERGLPPSMRAPLKVLSTAFWWAAFALSLLGVALFLLPKPIRIFDPIIICPGLFAAVAVLVVAQDRYHMPLNPFVAIFAAYGIEQFRRRKRAAKQLVEDV
jgi:hypothetical protein